MSSCHECLRLCDDGTKLILIPEQLNWSRYDVDCGTCLLGLETGTLVTCASAAPDNSVSVMLRLAVTQVSSVRETRDCTGANETRVEQHTGG